MSNLWVNNVACKSMKSLFIYNIYIKSHRLAITFVYVVSCFVLYFYFR